MGAPTRAVRALVLAGFAVVEEEGRREEEEKNQSKIKSVPGKLNQFSEIYSL